MLAAQAEQPARTRDLPHRTTMKIEDYALIGDTHTAALVRRGAGRHRMLMGIGNTEA